MTHFGTRRTGSATRRFVSDERGATAIEYALMASLIGLFIVTVVTALGTKVETLFETVKNAF